MLGSFNHICLKQFIRHTMQQFNELVSEYVLAHLSDNTSGISVGKVWLCWFPLNSSRKSCGMHSFPFVCVFQFCYIPFNLQLFAFFLFFGDLGRSGMCSVSFARHMFDVPFAFSSVKLRLYFVSKSTICS